MMSDKGLHLTKKDFRIEWFSGSGAGGQHRNKHQNCCRIIHVATGLKTQGTESRERPANQRTAFNRLSKLILAHFYADDPKIRIKARDTIRNYHGVRNEVHDKASGLKRPYKDIVTDGNISEMINARRTAIVGY
jgi:protein subunit release factor B